MITIQGSLYINGKYIEGTGEDILTVYNPHNKEIIAKLSTASNKDLDLAVHSASNGQKIWYQMTAVQRCRILLKAVELLRARNEELAKLETLNTGKPLSETEIVDIHTGADVIEYFAGLAVAIEGKCVPLRESSFFYTRKEPIGVCAGIGAWNYPIQIAMWKSAPALAAGNALIFKPSEHTPLSALKLAEIYSEAGLPDGVFNVVQGDYKVGKMLSEHPQIGKLSFTGSVNGGKKVMAQGALSSLKEVTMELGGKSPLIIFADANLDRAVAIAMMANFYSSGQVCTNGTRVFVHQSIKDAFVKKLLLAMDGVIIDNPMDKKTNFGPLVGEFHLKKVMEYIEAGVKEGATLIYGGKKPQQANLANGCYVEPTIFDNCTDEMSIVKEEIFGPVMSILSFSDEDEVVARANNTTYGLAAGVVTENINIAHRVIAKLQAGICWINAWGESPAQMPVGGFKESGIGFENGIDTLSHYTKTKSVQVELGQYESVFKK